VQLTTVARRLGSTAHWPSQLCLPSRSNRELPGEVLSETAPSTTGADSTQQRLRGHPHLTTGIAIGARAPDDGQVERPLARLDTLNRDLPSCQDEIRSAGTD
jgi:hypothetical protein